MARDEAQKQAEEWARALREEPFSPLPGNACVYCELEEACGKRWRSHGSRTPTGRRSTATMFSDGRSHATVAARRRCPGPVAHFDSGRRTRSSSSTAVRSSAASVTAIRRVPGSAARSR